jgi:hypothetical protein
MCFTSVTARKDDYPITSNVCQYNVLPSGVQIALVSGMIRPNETGREEPYLKVDNGVSRVS